ncbi:hypothetical protein E2C01_087852 [Portunus trituberculatus]|uniref:Uncharacterized protein n=1 Tax=Portunus trituberculatus TaxID=210409 RepID=A0A5B7JF65_PORTR|nr:hypothetical protein [Portunus trituberculatus]
MVVVLESLVVLKRLVVVA